MLGVQPKFQTCEKQKNRENKIPKEKQSHAQDSIYVVRQFAYVHRVARISLLSKKIITRTRQYLYSLAICLRPQSCRDFTIIKENTKYRYNVSVSQKTTTTTTKP